MPLATALPTPSAPARLRWRKNLSLLTPDEMTKFRRAMRSFMARQDNEGYSYFAGWHGVPMAICQHHVPLFLPWHRGYLLHFELALQRFDPTVSLPWWDWLNETGVPRAYALKRIGGRRNELASADINPIGIPPRKNWPKQTHRDPGKSAGGGPAPIPPPLNRFHPQPGQTSEQWLMAASSFDEMRRRLEALHDNMHVWVGGEMSDPTWAAYDPLFWAHHTMVDRLWRIWQHRHPNAPPPGIDLDRGMTYGAAPAFTPRQMLDVKSLGYDYAGTTSTVVGTR